MFLIPECFADLTAKVILSIQNINNKKENKDEDKIEPKKILDYLPITTLGKR